MAKAKTFAKSYKPHFGNSMLLKQFNTGRYSPRKRSAQDPESLSVLHCRHPNSSSWPNHYCPNLSVSGIKQNSPSSPYLLHHIVMCLRVDSTHTRHHSLKLFNPLPTAKPMYFSQRQIDHTFSHSRLVFSPPRPPHAIFSLLPLQSVLSYSRYLRHMFFFLHSDHMLLWRAS